NYTVYGNNTGGSFNVSINITVNDQVPTLSYSSYELTLTNNTTSNVFPLLPTTSGSGTIVSWGLNASLPSGMSFGTSNGTFFGTPTELWSRTSYTVWANNSGGSTIAYLNITVNDQVPTSVSYGNAGYELVLVNNTNPNGWVLPPTVEGHGTIVSWAINASLPSGVAFNTSNGQFSGKPTELWQRTPYMIWANNSGGSTIAYLNITVNDQVPSLSYSPNLVLMNVNQTSSDFPLEPVLSGSGAITSWELVGALPAGLSFGSSNGTFWGTPTSLQYPAVTYTVWANNSGGSTSTVVELSVVDAAPSSLEYSPSGQDVPLNTTMASMQATVTGGGPITNWTIHPPFLPTGVQFDENNGQMSGTPTELWTNTTYTVFANNSGGSVNTTFWLTVTLEAPNITYAMVNLSLVSNLTQVNYNGTNTGGELIYGSLSISGYSDTFCAVSEEGELWCWGDNNDKIVNVSASTSANLPPTKVPLPTGRYATSVDVGYEFACALLDNGSVACWGDAGTSGTSGSTALKQWYGDGYITPQLMAGIGSSRPAITLETGFAHACVTFLIGVPQCWGTDVWKNLGIAGTGSKVLPTNITVVPANRTVLDLSLGVTHVCALMDNASVMCWGENEHGGLGDNSTTDRENPVWPNLWGRSVLSVRAGHHHTCVGFTSGGASCWGHNYVGKLGDNSTTNRLVPVNVTGIANDTVFVSFELTYTTTCGRTTDGRTLCWGTHTGQNNGSSLVPAEVAFASNGTSTELAGDGDTMCAVLVNGSVACWGWGSERNFGVLTSPSTSYTPVYGVLETTTRSSPGGWMLDGVLPDGLQFSPSNGTLWGTPTEVNPSWVNFTVTAYNNAGTSSYSFSIQVLDQLPSFSYSPTTLNLVKGLASSELPLVPAMTGDGDITSWVISPALPSGLQLGSTNGTVYGLPSDVLSTTEFTVWANNSGGSSSATFNLTVVDQVPTLAYSPSDLTLVRGEAGSQLPLEATVAGAGEFLTWTISPPLSSGLSLDSSNGTLSGIPSSNASLTSYTITATNSGGNRTFVLNITVLEPLAVLSYTSLNLTRDLAMTPLSPTQSGGVAAQWGLSPALPSGLSFANGSFWGTPTVNMTTTTYTVWANNSGGSASTTFDITVLEPVGALSYTPENLTLYRNVSMSPLSPTYNGGSVAQWSVDPALPSGLVFTNGVITGTPQFNATTTVQYTVWANHSGGSVSASFNITVLEADVLVVYSPDEVNLVRNQTVLNLVPSVSGGTPDSWAIEPSLPEGLLFANGRIFGTATVNLTRTTYSVWANTTGGSNVVQLNLTVVEPLVELTFAPDEVVLVRNQSMTAITAGFNGGAVESWAVDPALPAGLRFLNGVLSGTPEVNMTRSSYTLWANNSGGPVSVMFNLTVLEPAVDFAYQPNTLLLTRNQSMATVVPIVLNDAGAESWGISPALPSGLWFDNGTVYGRPTVNLTATSFTVWANNSGGSTARTLLITVLEPVATVRYEPDNMTVTRGQENLSMVPLLGGGAVATWSITPELPDGLRFENGTLYGVAQVQAPLAMYTVTAENSGGLVLAYVNLTVLEPVAVLSINSSFVETRGKAPVNATVNNTGGSVANWDISPALPSGVRLLNGLIYGSARVNMTQTTFTVWANNSGGSASVNFTLEILEPRANITYGQSSVELVTGITTARILPLVSGGVPQYWAVEPALPEGLRLEAGVILGVAMNSSEATTYTVWANNSGGSATTSITLTVNWPIHFARYPVPRLVLDVNETLPAQYPVISFTSVQDLSWSIEPALPEGFTFVDGVVSGVPVNASDETNYTVSVTGQMAPLQLYFTLEVQDIEVVEVPRLDNNNTMEEVFIVPEQEVYDSSFNMYYICPPILIFSMLIGAMAINNYLKRSGYIELEEEAPGSDDDIAP
ncbi:MAG: hypothetical protein DWC07_06820, partial [Candidatus Poseidoniales archaeon]